MLFFTNLECHKTKSGSVATQLPTGSQGFSNTSCSEPLVSNASRSSAPHGALNLRSKFRYSYGVLNKQSLFGVSPLGDHQGHPSTLGKHSFSTKGFRSNDTLADFLSRIRNGYFRSFEEISVIDCKQTRELLDAFLFAGYIHN